MNFLVIGLGSMGKRRIRCLRTLGHNEIAGFDVREDRRTEVSGQYGIKTYSDIDTALQDGKPNVFIISVPPDLHHVYMKLAVQEGVHFFAEATVVDTGMHEIIADLKKADIVGVPSATLLFHPAIKIISKVIEDKELGKISNVIYHSGQYLPDWHTYELVSDFYVSNPVTGGAREIVHFELTWLTEILGFPQKVCGVFKKTIDIKGAEKIDDTYNFLLEYDDCLAAVSVDVVSRFSTRKLLINGDKKQLTWDWNSDRINIYDPQKGRWDSISYAMSPAAEGYNENVGENMYVDELDAFIESIQSKKPYVNSFEKDCMVLNLLYTIEESYKKQEFISCRT